MAGYGAQDYLRGDEGDDTIVGGQGPDDLEGGGGFDRLTDMQGNNIVSDLTLTGATGAAVLTGSGNDTVEVKSDEQAAEITVSSGAGADRVYLSGLISTGRVMTGAGDDFIGMQLDAAGDLVVRGQRDDAGPLRLVSAVQDDADGELVRLWRVERASVGPVEVSYLARPILDEPRLATPPLELRRDGTELSGALKCFLVLPLVFTGVRRPGPGTFGPRFEMTEVHVPVLDVGFEPSTFITHRVKDLVSGGPADRAGLKEGNTVELPSYPEALALNADDGLNIRVTRDGETSLLTIPLSGQTTPVPQWHKPGDVAEPR